MRALARRTVLVVEDDDDLRTMLAFALRAAGFHVYETDDGVTALKIVEDTPPDAVVLDLMLPTLDGLSVRHEIAAHADTRHIPVIIVTGAAIDASGLNVAALLRKPIEPADLVTAVRQALQGVPQPPTQRAAYRAPDRQ
jgi:DNA-binding response OmpR family regulator